MKTIMKATLIALLAITSEVSLAQYTTCPHGQAASGSQVGYLSWRFIDPSTGANVTSLAPNPYADKVYRMEIYQDGAPANTAYSNIGIQGTADGFRIFYSQNDANSNNTANSYTDDQVSSGIGPDVGANKTAVFYIRTLPTSDPNWSGQLTAFKAYGICYPGSMIGSPNKYYKKTLIFRN